MAEHRAVATDVEQWRDLISNTFVPLEPTLKREAVFSGEISTQLADDIAVMRVESVAQTVSRTAAGCRSTPACMIKVLVQRVGEAGVQQRDRRALLPPGGMTVYDTSEPYAVVERADFCADVLMVPRERLPLTRDTVAALQERPIDTARGPGALFLSYLDDFRERLHECSPLAAARCTSILLDLLGLALAEAPTVALPSAALRVSVLDWITRHLADENLGPAVIASANGISVRYLHRLFEASGVSVSGYIRSQRLRRIRQDLGNPMYQRHTIAAVGARWGIPDQAHLSRLFRAEFALTPSDARRQWADVG
jgi:AraC-like DNA-binding protein